MSDFTAHPLDLIPQHTISCQSKKAKIEKIEIGEQVGETIVGKENNGRCLQDLCGGSLLGPFGKPQDLVMHRGSGPLHVV
jgi:hypothetical protein